RNWPRRASTMTAMMIDGGKRVAAGWARLQWHMMSIADIDLIARNTGENAVASSLRGSEALNRFKRDQRRSREVSSRDVDIAQASARSNQRSTPHAFQISEVNHAGAGGGAALGARPTR